MTEEEINQLIRLIKKVNERDKFNIQVYDAFVKCKQLDDLIYFAIMIQELHSAK